MPKTGPYRRWRGTGGQGRQGVGRIVGHDTGRTRHDQVIAPRAVVDRG